MISSLLELHSKNASFVEQFEASYLLELAVRPLHTENCKSVEDVCSSLRLVKTIVTLEQFRNQFNYDSYCKNLANVLHIAKTPNDIVLMCNGLSSATFKNVSFCDAVLTHCNSFIMYCAESFARPCDQAESVWALLSEVIDNANVVQLDKAYKMPKLVSAAIEHIIAYSHNIGEKTIIAGSKVLSRFITKRSALCKSSGFSELLPLSSLINCAVFHLTRPEVFYGLIKLLLDMVTHFSESASAFVTHGGSTLISCGLEFHCRSSPMVIILQKLLKVLVDVDPAKNSPVVFASERTERMYEKLLYNFLTDSETLLEVFRGLSMMVSLCDKFSFHSGRAVESITRILRERSDNSFLMLEVLMFEGTSMKLSKHDVEAKHCFSSKVDLAPAVLKVAQKYAKVDTIVHYAMEVVFLLSTFSLDCNCDMMPLLDTLHSLMQVLSAVNTTARRDVIMCLARILSCMCSDQSRDLSSIKNLGVADALLGELNDRIDQKDAVLEMLSALSNCGCVLSNNSSKMNEVLNRISSIYSADTAILSLSLRIQNASDPYNHPLLSTSQDDMTKGSDDKELIATTKQTPHESLDIIELIESNIENLESVCSLSSVFAERLREDPSLAAKAKDMNAMPILSQAIRLHADSELVVINIADIALSMIRFLPNSEEIEEEYFLKIVVDSFFRFEISNNALCDQYLRAIADFLSLGAVLDKDAKSSEELNQYATHLIMEQTASVSSGQCSFSLLHSVRVECMSRRFRW